RPHPPEITAEGTFSTCPWMSCAIPLPREPSGNLTRLERWIAPRAAESGGRSGFRLLSTGLDAFVARGLLIELAERTLDLQYYIFHADHTGSLVIERLIAAGPVAGQSCDSFMAYWDSSFAVPITELTTSRLDDAAFTAARHRLHDRCEQLRDSSYARALAESDLAKDLRAHALHLHWADAEIIADPPDKLTQPVGARSATFLGAQISPHARAARSDLLVVSPYFVPGEEGVAFFGERRRDGVTVRVLTNSLAATDVWLVHAGYMKYRRPLLATGVRLYELRPEAAGTNGPRRSGIAIGS